MCLLDGYTIDVLNLVADVVSYESWDLRAMMTWILDPEMARSALSPHFTSRFAMQRGYTSACCCWLSNYRAEVM